MSNSMIVSTQMVKHVRVDYTVVYCATTERVEYVWEWSVHADVERYLGHTLSWISKSQNKLF